MYVKRFISLLCILLFIWSTGRATVFAEVDPAKLMEILSALAGTGVVVPPTGTGTVVHTQTGANTTTNTTTNPVTTTQTNKVHHLEVTLSPTGKVGEPMDITITAVAQNGSIFPSYLGTVFISVDNDYGAIVPYKYGYTFTSSDQGKKTFSSWLSFSKIGSFQVSVVDSAQSELRGTTSVTVSKQDAITTQAQPITTQNPLTPPQPTKAVADVTTSTIPSFKILKVETGDKKATFTFSVLNETSDIRKFQFIYADKDGKSNKVITYNKEQIKKADGSYVWYIPDLSLTKYVVSIAWVGGDGETIPWIVSQPFEADLSLLSAGKCIIPNVSGLRVLAKKDTSVLYWDSIPEAMNYKIYKKNTNGEYVFVEDTKNDSYTIYVANGSVRYDDFSVKAVCSDGTESLQFAPSTSVRTGPSVLIILSLISAIIGFILVRKRKKSFEYFTK